MIRISTNAGAVIKQLKAYSNSLDAKMRELMQKLGEIGLEKANAKYTEAEYDGLPDDNPIGPEWIGDNTLMIGYEGPTILFIEFGTGVTYADQHELAAQFGYTRGGYGHGLGKLSSWRYIGPEGSHGKESETHPGWTETQGNPPNRVMYEASKEMRKRISDIAKEVFHK